jgi:RNA polymerase sigma-70 factor, ECF subfamily
LFITVKNRSLNKIQAETIRREYSSRFLFQQNNEVLQTELEQKEFREHLFRCIQKLPPRCKDVFVESRFKKMKQDQIAEKMQISLKTVKAQVGKALRYIQNCLQIYYPEYFRAS